MKPAFKHMGPRDVELFAAFVLTPEGKAFDRWQFDVRVAEGRCPASFVDPTQREGMLALTQLRIDAVGWKGSQPTIIEVKPEAHLSAFGQLQAYEWYWIREQGIVPWKMLVTDSCSADMKTLYEAHGIAYRCIPPALPGEIEQARLLVTPITIR